MLFPFRCSKLEKFEVPKFLTRRIRAILRPRAWQNCRNEELPLEPNLETDITGDVGKFHDTYIVHIAKFMTTRDHTLLVSNPFSQQRPFGRHLLFEIFLFNCILRQTGTRHFRWRLCWWYLFTEVESRACSHNCSKKCRLLWTCTGFVFNHV